MGSRRTPRLTRREWTAAVASIASAAPLRAQVPSPPVTAKTPPQGSPAPASSATSPEQKLQKAYADVHDTSERLAKIEVPMDVEPAFAFRP